MNASHDDYGAEASYESLALRDIKGDSWSTVFGGLGVLDLAFGDVSNVLRRYGGRGTRDSNSSEVIRRNLRCLKDPCRCRITIKHRDLNAFQSYSRDSFVTCTGGFFFPGEKC